MLSSFKSRIGMEEAVADEVYWHYIRQPTFRSDQEFDENSVGLKYKQYTDVVFGHTCKNPMLNRGNTPPKLLLP